MTIQEIEVDAKARLFAMRELQNSDPRPLFGPRFRGGSMLIHRDLQEPNCWRVTHFDEAMEPLRHMGPNTFFIMIEVAHWDGDVRKLTDPPV